ncbi:dienelactone hydrolase family protein [Paludibacterium paludis]|uniref:Xaa-Pro dipeptidyl-peptidase-like domain-containing protein n=1 Tax=Paludibacterium paludis TaxID=1225769 RepID=A0A918P2X2_9NEIS|nr:CocE/NonD family hydrolase [Paludibacterium paludis]GGY15677.1 hypothetical protein GCM10011289_18760 [Paludibacterium paludis]
MTLPRGIVVFAALLRTASAAALEIPPDPSLNESVLDLPTPAGRLRTTLFVPGGKGPFPLVVINHGKPEGDAATQPRFRPLAAVGFFLARGYLVAVPMRGGFAGSEGVYRAASCDSAEYGKRQAADVEAALAVLARRADVDRSRILVVGVSSGGWASLALGARGVVGIRGVIDFAGGVRLHGCPSWQADLADAAGTFGGRSRVPSLWLYGSNDSLFPEPVWRAMFGRYRQAGGRAVLVSYGVFERDAHTLFTTRSGLDVWSEPVESFLRGLGLPASVTLPRFVPPPAMPLPGATSFAALSDWRAVPFLAGPGRQGYRLFLGKPSPRAFALAADGAWGAAWQGDDPAARALATCRRTSRAVCSLYAVDDTVVWSAPRR